MNIHQYSSAIPLVNMY